MIKKQTRLLKAEAQQGERREKAPARTWRVARLFSLSASHKAPRGPSKGRRRRPLFMSIFRIKVLVFVFQLEKWSPQKSASPTRDTQTRSKGAQKETPS